MGLGKYVYCAVSENTHTPLPPTKGIRISWGWGGVL